MVTAKDNTKREKIPCIPPSFHNNKYVTSRKEWNFNCFFAYQCSLIPSNSILPSKFKLLLEHTLTSCDFSETGILQIVNNQDSNKADGYGMISICMLQLCGETICRPIQHNFKNMSKYRQVSFRIEGRQYSSKSQKRLQAKC